MIARRIIVAVAVAAMLWGGTSGATSKVSTTTRSQQDASSVSCGSMVLTNPATGQLAVGSGTPLSTSARLDGISATLSGSATMASSPHNQPALAGATIKVLVHGKQVMSSSLVTPQAPAGSPFIPATIGPIGAPTWYSPYTGGSLNNTNSGYPLCIARFGGAHPQTAVLVGAYTGLQHCCAWIEAFPVVSNTLSPTPLEKYIGNPQAGVIESGRHAVIVTADNAFDYEFACFFCSGTPVLAFEIRGARFVNVTDQHLDWVNADAGYWWGLFVSSQPGQGLGVLAAWVADECRLGYSSQAFSTLDQLEAQGTLNSSNSGWPSGSAFVTQLRSFLSAHGYPT